MASEVFAGMVFDGPGGAWAAALWLVLVIALVSREVKVLRGERSPRRKALLALRVLTVIALFLLATQPAFVVERVRRIEGKTAVLVDTSRSMELAVGGSTRAKEAAALAARLAREGAEVRSFGDRLRPFDPTEPNTRRPSASTRLIAALEALEGESSIGSVVLLSDGLETERARLDRPFRFPVHAVAIGGEEPRVDVSILRLRADPMVYLRERSTVEVTLGCAGACDEPVEVRLAIDGMVVDAAVARFEGGGSARVKLEFEARKLGRHVGQVSLIPPEGDVVPENDRRSFLFRVERDRLRVLLVAGSPAWDVRFLRELLERNPALDMVSFFILRTVDDLTMADTNEMALIPFPTDELFREHLGSFDLVIFQNFDYGPYRMEIYLPRIRDYVMRGGAFAMIGGEKSLSAGGYAGTPVASILPVELPAGKAVDPREFRPVPAVPRHPLVSLGEPAREVPRRWAETAPLAGWNQLGALREGARALLVHPFDRVGGQARPILAVGEAGEGRVLVLATDSSFRWGITTAGARGDLSHYERFWDAAIRYLSRDPSLEPSRLSTDRERVALGAEVVVRGEFADDDYEPRAGEAVALRVVTEAGQVVSEAEVLLSAHGELQERVQAPDAPGVYFVVVAPQGGGEPLASAPFLVEGEGDELARVRPDAALLSQIAEESGGRFFASPDDVPELDALREVEERVVGEDRRSPFREPWFAALALVLFTAELLVRRRLGRT
ncbi:MAG: hypothetical protein GXY23_09885 [Myxococcales bacterium]|nr:hypothetical protein [Myxococcales bacterium]